MKDASARKNVSIKIIITIVFIFAMLISIGVIGSLIFANWVSSAKQTTEGIAGDINENIYRQIYSFMRMPEQINESNHNIIASGMMDLSDEESRDKFFAGVLSSYDHEIYSFSYGTAAGEYYGAHRNESGAIEIIKNNINTGGNLWYYSVNEDFTARALAVQDGQFDPRTRAWYKAAVETGGPTFSPVYKHFTIDNLTISAACPVYGSNGELQGVLGTHILLSGIGDYLESIVQDYNGYAVILEKSTGDLIANSMNMQNFLIFQDDTLKKHNISEIDNSEIREAYEKYRADLKPDFFYEGKKQNLYINIRELHMKGLDWAVISAIPEEFLMARVVNSIRLTVLLVVLILLLSLIIYNLVTGKLLKPMDNLLQVSEALSSGDLSRRTSIVRNDEIGRISSGLNKLADKMQFLINNLEATVDKRTEELYRANEILEENKNQLQLILDSTAEAVYGINLDGNCTFCNASCMKILGYESQDQLLGKHMHTLIHHTRPDGTPFPVEECKLCQAVKEGRGSSSDDEMFWRADGTSFETAYHAYPQIKNGAIIGAVITFMDITDRKKKEKEIQYLNCHDTLTGLYNRRCFEDNRNRVDTPDNLPLSVIFADINGLKMTNDIFGHASGDALIKKSSEILTRSCRKDDIIARAGGDEFIILLPNTDKQNAEIILSRIRSGFSKERVAAIKCSVSLGSDTKTSADQPIEEIISNAENAMYKDKTMNRKSNNKDIIDTIIETLHSKSSRERQHSIAVSQLCGDIGTALRLPQPAINKLKRASYLHDIGKIILDDSIFQKDLLIEDEYEKMQQHSAVGYRILNLFDDTLDLAEDVYSHHERWDGKGYPRGLKGEEIPMLSRIISIAETYDRIAGKRDDSAPERKRKALDIIREGAGKQFDPQIAEVFAALMEDRIS